MMALAPGMEVSLSKHMIVRPFTTNHRVVSQGYIVYRRRKKLLDEFV